MPPKNLIRLLSDLIAIPSVNPMGREVQGAPYFEKPIAEFVAQRARSLGLDTEIFEHRPGRTSVLARLDAGARETLLLDAHLDTVSHENMEIPPFEPTRSEGRVYGRGACDTKASLAIFLCALEDILRRGNKPTRNVILAACADEEFSFGGVRELARRGLKADGAVVGEPTELEILAAHKGVLRCFVRARGESCHASTPEAGRNAIYLLAEAILLLKKLHDELQRRPPHPVLGHATLSVGMAGGGQTPNTVPAAAWLEIDRRLLPGETPEAVVREIRRALAGLAHVEVEDPYLDSGGFETKSAAGACALIHRAQSACGLKPSISSAPYATHAPFYEKLSIPAAVFGPGSIRRAHTASEYVEEDQLEKALAVLLRMLTS